MSVRAAWAVLGGLALAAASSSSVLARVPELPRELRGRVAIEITRCRPVGRGDALLEAELRVRANETALALPGLHCGAYDDAGAPFFLTPVTGRLNLRANASQHLTVRFAADAAHRECGCTLRDVRALARESAPGAFGDVDAEFEALVAQLSGVATATANEAAPTAIPETPGVASEAEPASTGSLIAFAVPALRYERVLAPNAPLRAEPSAKAAITGVALPGARVAVDRIERGWKLARTPDGLVGWLPSDASTADIAAPERMAERLAPLHRALAPGASTSEALCASLERSALRTSSRRGAYTSAPSTCTPSGTRSQEKTARPSSAGPRIVIPQRA